MKSYKLLTVVGFLLLLLDGSGCTQTSPQVRDRRQTVAKLKNGLTQEEVALVLGQPNQVRPGNGSRDDVAVYQVQGETFTVYFYQGHLTRYVSSQKPVNR